MNKQNLTVMQQGIIQKYKGSDIIFKKNQIKLKAAPLNSNHPSRNLYHESTSNESLQNSFKTRNQSLQQQMKDIEKILDIQRDKSFNRRGNMSLMKERSNNSLLFQDKLQGQETRKKDATMLLNGFNSDSTLNEENLENTLPPISNE